MQQQKPSKKMPEFTSTEEILGLGEPSAELQELLQQYPATGPFSTGNSKAETKQLRAQFSQAATPPSPTPAHIAEVDKNIRVRDGSEIPIRIYSPKEATQGGSPLIVNYHGGGWNMGDLSMCIDFCRSLVTSFKAVVVDVDYRLAPEFPFPTPVNDSWDALLWAAQNAKSLKADPTVGFLVSGASAGANIACVLSQQARDEKLAPPLTGSFLSALPAFARDNVPVEFISSWLSYEQNKEAPILNRPLYDFIIDCYKPDSKSPAFAPILDPAGFVNLPPTYFAVCGLDSLRDDGIIYERALRNSGGNTKIDIYPGLPHCWWGILPQLKATATYEKDSLAGLQWLLNGGK